MNFIAERNAATPDSVLPRDRLSIAGIYAIFIGWTLFSVYVYSRYSQLGDAQSYLTGAYGESAQARTWLITLVATRLISLLRSDLLAHLAFSLFVASGVSYLIRQARVHGRYRWPLLTILLIPNFGVWASVVGRESLFAGFLGFFMGAVIGYHRERGLHRIVIASVCLAGMTFVRAPFGAGIGLFFAMFLAYTWGPRIRLSIGVQALSFIAVGMLVLVSVWPDLDRYIGGEVLPKAQSYFTVASATTRTWVGIDTTVDLFKSLWWSLPLSLLGPTPAEALARPVMLPFLASGLIVLGLLLSSVYLSLRKAPSATAQKILLLGWLPALALILVSYVPFGIYNPGSGIRYASCFLLFLIFPQMFLSGMSAEASEQPFFRAADGRERQAPEAR